MDETPEYIKMCEMAKEVQEQWDLEDDTNYISQILDDYAMTMAYMGHQINSTLKILEANNQGQNYVWTPRIDQLQDMVELPPHPYDKVITSIEEMNSVYKGIHDKEVGETWERFWLALVMWKKFNKVWNGEDWVSA